ncbi:unnamed protein product [Dracunculus medinensis]|uniref:PAN domain protein n=1 Tax=Dracunculus medinensis TaxID=318479 RepID=A0A0N4UR53_DRAME|nr:unnamed protein product [Dracunculus medinensis]
MKYTDDVSSELICVQECACISEQYEKKDGQCIEKNDTATRIEAELSVENLFKGTEKVTPTSTQRFVTKEFSAQITAQKTPAEVPTPKVCSGRICRLDEIITDTLCSLTDQKCGPNMVFRTIVGPLRMKVGISSYKMCIQQCTCDSNEYTKIGGQCIKEKSVPMRKETELSVENLFKGTEKVTPTSTQRFVTKEFSAQITAQKTPAEVPTPKVCSGRICRLDEIITDTLCSLTDQKCGPNMVFRTIVGPLRMKVGISSYKMCIQQCTCDSNEYTKIGGQCIKEKSVPMRKETEFDGEILPKHCAGRVCALDEEIFNAPCSLTGKICGTNMIFNNIGKLLKKNGTVVCFQKCTCMSEEYVKANGQCILSAKGNENMSPALSQRSITERSQFPVQPTIQKISKTHSNYAGRSCERVRDLFCTLTGQTCGDNMVYKTIKRLIYIDDSPEICIQQCKCANKEYTEKDGRCIIRERSVKKNHAHQVTFYCAIAKLP